VDPNNFLNFEATTFEMFVASTRIMGCVLGVVAVFTLAIYGVVKSVTNILAGVEDQFSMDHNYNETDFEDAMAEEENNAAALAVSTWAAGECACLVSLMVMFHAVNGVRVYVLMWWSVALAPVGVLVFVEVGGGSISSTGLSLLSIAIASNNPCYFHVRVHQRPGIGHWFVRRAPGRQASSISRRRH